MRILHVFLYIAAFVFPLITYFYVKQKLRGIIMSAISSLSMVIAVGVFIYHFESGSQITSTTILLVLALIYGMYILITVDACYLLYKYRKAHADKIKNKK